MILASSLTVVSEICFFLSKLLKQRHDLFSVSTLYLDYRYKSSSRYLNQTD